ncbi:iron chaperone [Gordonia sp. DT218]|uniref:iron chaperone n=1 Tax=Gordonia sp. DT218 TaxID=3416659 RepID=UPI003CF08D66
MGTVDDHLAGLDPDDRAAVDRVYSIARELVPDTEQGTGYGMPALTYRGKPLLSVMRTKKHIGVYPFSRDAVAVAAPRLVGFDLDKGTIRFQPDTPLPDDAVRAMVSARRDQIADG